MSIPGLCLQLWWTTWKPSHQAEQSLALGKLDPVLRGMENQEERVLVNTSITTKYTININITSKIRREGSGSMPSLALSGQFKVFKSKRGAQSFKAHEGKKILSVQFSKLMLC